MTDKCPICGEQLDGEECPSCGYVHPAPPVEDALSEFNYVSPDDSQPATEKPKAENLPKYNENQHFPYNIFKPQIRPDSLKEYIWANLLKLLLSFFIPFLGIMFNLDREVLDSKYRWVYVLATALGFLIGGNLYCRFMMFYSNLYN